MRRKIIKTNKKYIDLYSTDFYNTISRTVYDYYSSKIKPTYELNYNEIYGVKGIPVICNMCMTDYTNFLEKENIIKFTYLQNIKKLLNKYIINDIASIINDYIIIDMDIDHKLIICHSIICESCKYYDFIMNKIKFCNGFDCKYIKKENALKLHLKHCNFKVKINDTDDIINVCIEKKIITKLTSNKWLLYNKIIVCDSLIKNILKKICKYPCGKLYAMIKDYPYTYITGGNKRNKYYKNNNELSLQNRKISKITTNIVIEGFLKDKTHYLYEKNKDIKYLKTNVQKYNNKTYMNY